MEKIKTQIINSIILLLNLGGVKLLYQIALKGSECSLLSRQVNESFWTSTQATL